MKVDNAIIMAAGTSSRFAPLSYEKPKSLIEVKGEVLLERQIRQLQEAGVPEIFIVTGYKAEQFVYLKEKFGVQLINNPDYLTRNNNGSIWCARNILHNTYICSSDNYFTVNPFEKDTEECYYAAEFSERHTAEWCMTEDENGYIDSVTIGGENAWYMLGHAFWSEEFSKKFLEILEREYSLPETKDKLWEKIFMAHLDELKMKIRKYPPGVIFEFDTIDELRAFDASYKTDSRSVIMKKIAEDLCISESEIVNLVSVRSANTEAAGFIFDVPAGHYQYLYDTGVLKKVR
ncbi:MAG: NTP transferase domain-containing protein [Acidaminococcaceae bacterium]|nr:NTP transferase domain-containing protein [Acidaminococcaceae bacterium]